MPAAGHRLTSAWTIARVEYTDTQLRFVTVDPRGRTVALTLDADPRASAKSPVRPLTHDSSDVPVAEFADAAQRLAVLLIHASPGGHPFRAFDQLLASARAAGARPAGAPIPRWRLRLEDGLSFVEGQGARAVEVFADPEALVAALGSSATSVRVLPLDGAADGAWRAPLLRAVAQRADALGAELELRYRLHEGSRSEVGALLSVIAWLSDRGSTSVRLALELGEQPFAVLTGLPEVVRDYALHRLGLHSAAGKPLCWFSHHLPDARGRASRVPAPEEIGRAGTFGPDCAGCTLRPDCEGVSTAYAERFGFDELRPLRAGPDGNVSWQDRARWMLVGRPFRSIPLRDALPVLPNIACVRPWTRFELHEGGSYGPCCSDFMETKAPEFPAEPDLPAIWDGELFRSFRRAMLDGGHPKTCRTICPVLVGRTDSIERMWLKGGTSENVENQVRTVDAMLDGQDRIGTVPVSFNVATTSFCNYDCLMCNCGREGTLKDEKTADFYERLAVWEDRMIIIEANGGEPLASPNYRAFVKRVAASDRPASLQITTNGSLMTPKWLEALPRLPFTKICISLNAASDDTYLAVNRGLTWSGIRKNVDALLQMRNDGRYHGLVTYSMVVLRRNLHEVRAFAEMAIRDGTEVRYMLPMRDLDGQTVMTSRDTMLAFASALEDVLVRLREHGMTFSVMDAEARLKVLRQRLDEGILAPL